ncbi:hypothetical protein PybrP1_002385 [[Pythium] brassicae (nom. inval.)]|nr:hypothetical protein PybrP1_002385 [[Pythium] brassicae (nom. inval.)]
MEAGRRARKKEKKVRVNLTLCKYEVVRKIARDRGWVMVTDENDRAGIAACNLHWIDVPDFLNTFKILLPYQKVNHFPGMSNLARKSKLARNFERMKKLFPDEFDFCPRTWILPFDLHDFQTHFNADGVSYKTFIVKPDHSCQGRGVFLTRNLSQISRTDVLVAQQYIARPLLIAGKKFDLRIYVLVTSCSPLRVYLFKDGLVRMCTADYVTPNANNMEQRFMHLTNYAVNKHANNFELNKDASADGSGSKRSLRWFFAWLKESHDEPRVDALWDKIGDICLKSILAVQPLLAQEYRSTFAKNLRKSVCSASPGGPSQLPGSGLSDGSTRPSTASEASMDVLVDEGLKPWLLEVNHLPSFGCDSPLDWNIKERLISQTFDILQISADDKDRYEAEQARSTQARLYGASASSASSSHSGSAGSNNQSSDDDQLPEIYPNKQQPSVHEPEHDDSSAFEATDTFHALSLDALREALAAYYRQFNANRLKDLDKIVAKYGGAQEELDRSLRLKYGKSVNDFVSKPASSCGPETSATPALQGEDEHEEALADFILLYPSTSSPDLLAHCKYHKMLEASQQHMNEQQMRFSAPLQHRKASLDESSGGGGAGLPPLKGAQKKDLAGGRDCFGFTGTDKAKWLAGGEKRPLAVPGPTQVAAAHRLMLGHSSRKLSIQPPTPPEVQPRTKEQVNYGLQYRERLETLKHKPTVAMSQISFGCFD